MNSFCLVCSLMIMMRKSLGRITFKPIHFIHFVSSRVLFAYIYIHTAVISKPIIIFTLGVFSLLYSDFSFRFVTTIDEYAHMFHENPSLSKKRTQHKSSSSVVEIDSRGKSKKLEGYQSREDSIHAHAS